MPPATTIHVACLQLNSTESIEDNLNQIKTILSGHKDKHFDLLLLPENALLLTRNPSLKSKAAQEYQALFHSLGEIAREQKSWLIAGSLLINDPDHEGKMFNHCPVFSPDGSLAGSYNKMHLFDADLTAESWRESSHITAGNAPAMVSMDPAWKIGLSICYDLRFPELYRYYSEHGCNIMTVPAAFTVATGEAHWQVLLRARAIENQCYVLAAGQSGAHADGRQTYGHSMIINPWGEVIAQIENGTGLIEAELSVKQLTDIQRSIPALKHRRV